MMVVSEGLLYDIYFPFSRLLGFTDLPISSVFIFFALVLAGGAAFFWELRGYSITFCLSEIDPTTPFGIYYQRSPDCTSAGKGALRDNQARGAFFL
jgi:hypothetical protein